MFAETYLIDHLQTEASLENLYIAGCTYSLAIERLCPPPNPKIAGEEAPVEVTLYENLMRDIVVLNR